jgi:hypothetical protein
MDKIKEKLSEKWLLMIIATTYVLGVGIYLYHFVVMGHLNVVGDLPHTELIYFFSKFPDFNQYFLTDLAHPKLFHSIVGVWNIFVGANDYTIVVSTLLFNSFFLLFFLTSVYITAELYFGRKAALYSTMLSFLLSPILPSFFSVNDHASFYALFPLFFYIAKRIEEIPSLLSVLVLGALFSTGSLAFFIPCWFGVLMIAYRGNEKILTYALYGIALFLPFIFPVFLRMIGVSMELMDFIGAWIPLGTLIALVSIFIFNRYFLGKRSVQAISVISFVIAIYILLIDNFGQVDTGKLDTLLSLGESNLEKDPLSIIFSIDLGSIFSFENLLFAILMGAGIKTYSVFKNKKNDSTISPLVWIMGISLAFMVIHGIGRFFFLDYYITTRFFSLNHQGRILFYISLAILGGYGVNHFLKDQALKKEITLHTLFIVLIFYHVFSVQLVDRIFIERDKIGLTNQYNGAYAEILDNKLLGSESSGERIDYYSCTYYDICHE